jgi:PKD repeat protein
LVGLALTILLFVFADAAPADWTPAVTVTEGGTQYSFGQDLGPNGDGTTAWSAPSSTGSGYSVSARKVGATGSLGPKVAISTPNPGAVFTSSYAPAVRYDSTGTATVVWLESSYGSASCFNESGEPKPGEGESDCEVEEYVKSRQIATDGTPSTEQVIYHRHVVYPADGSFGGGSGAYVTYGQPSLVGGAGNTLTVVWPESTFGSGCAAYGYSSSYSDSECEAEEKIKWVRLSSAGVPQGVPQAVYEEHVAGYGSGQPLLRLRVGAASDGTATVLFSARASVTEASCWGGESFVRYLRIGPTGTAAPVKDVGSGCGSTSPDLAVDPSGTVFAVWGWEGTYSSDEALFTRISAAGTAETPQTLLASSEGAHVAGLDVARGAAGSATAVWAAEGSVHSRRLPLSGAPGPIVDVAAPGAGHYFSSPRLAVAPDDSSLVVWEDGSEFGDGRGRALQAQALAPNGSSLGRRTLLAANRWDHGTRISAGSAGAFMASWRISVPHHNRIQAARLSTEAAQSNDDFANAQAIDSELPSFASGSNESASKQTGEPNHAGSPGGASVWYSWTPASSGPVTLSTCSAGSLDPVLGVYTGAVLTGLTTVATATAGAPALCAAGDSGVRFQAQAGITYRIAVDGENGTRGSFGLKLISRADAPSNDEFAAAKDVSGSLPRYISGSNADASKQTGEPSHAGNSGGASVWYSWTASRTAKARLTVCGSGLENPLLGVYTGSGVGSLTAVTGVSSGSAECPANGTSLRFDAVLGTTYRIAVDGRDGREGRFSLRLAQEPANNEFNQAQVLVGLPNFFNASTVVASKQAGEPNHAGDPGGASVWYSWTPSSSGTAVVSACMFAGKEQSALLAVYTGADVEHLTPVASDAGGGSTVGCFSHYSEVRFDFHAGTEYRLAVDGEGGVEASFSLFLEQLPINDSLAEAQVLAGSVPQFVSATNRHASKQAGEPNHAGDPGGASVWYSWMPSSSGTAVVSACMFAGKEQSALLAVYTGADVAHLTAVDSDLGGGSTNGCFNHYSEIRLDFQAGTRYYIAVDGKGGSQGYFSLAIEPLPANDAFAAAQQLEAPQTVSATNRHASKQVGEPVHAGNAGGASVWYSWTPSISGTGTVSVCPSFGTSALLAVYTGPDLAHLTEVAADVGGGSGGCFGPPSEVQFDAAPGTHYYIAVDGKDGIEASFSLNLSFEAMPQNDDFANPRLLGAPETIAASNRQSSKQAGEPNHAGDPGGASVWFTWTPSSSGIFGLSTCSSGALDPLLAVYTGSSVAALSPVASNNDGPSSPCSSDDSEVRFAATAGTTYRIAVDGKGGTTGPFELELAAAAANDDLAAATALSGPLPRSAFGSNRFASKQAGEPNHAGNAGGVSVWYSWTAPSSGPAEVSACSFGPLDPLLAVYTGSSPAGLVAVSGTDRGPSQECSNDSDGFRFSAVAGTTYRIAIDGKGGLGGGYSFTLRGVPANDNFAAATPIEGGLPLFASGENRLGGKEGGEPVHAGNPGGASVWFKWTPASSGTISISTCSFGALDPLLAVYSGEALAGLKAVASNDDAGRVECSGKDGEVRFAAVAGTTYRIAVDGKNGSEGDFSLRLKAASANDDFAQPEQLEGNLPIFRSGFNRVASKQVGEPDHAGNPGGASVWFKWTPSSSGSVALSTCAFSGFDSLLAVYTGETLAGLKAVASNDDTTRASCTGKDGEVRFAAVAGTTYRIAVDGKNGSEGDFQLRLSPAPPVNDDFADAIEIPQARTSIAGTNVAATSQSGEGFSAEQTVWYRMVAKENGVVRLHTCSDVGAPMDVDVFTGSSPGSLSPVQTASGTAGGCNVGSGGAGGGSAPAMAFGDTPTVAFNAVAGTTYRISVDRYFQISPVMEQRPAGPFLLLVNAPANDLRSAAERVPNAGGTIDRSNLGATREAGESNHAGIAGGASVWFRWFASADGPVTIDTCGSAIDTLLAAEDLSGEVAAGDNSTKCGAGSTASSFGFEAEEGTDYAIAVDGKAGQTGAVRLHVGFSTLDTTVPETSAFIPAATNTSQLNFSVFRDEPESHFECALDSGPLVPCQISGDGESATGVVTGLTEGNHLLSIREVDKAGNADPTPVLGGFAVDTDPPETSIAEGPEGLTRLLGPFGFSSDEAGSFECWLDSGVSQFCGSTYFAPGSLADGDHVLHVKAVDLAGNRDASPSTRAFHLDRTAPVSSVDQGPEGTVESSSASFKFSANEVGTFRCKIDGGAEVDCASPKSYSGLSDADHVFSVKATDTAGNVGAAATRTFHVENRVPQTTIDAGPPARTALSTAHFEFGADEEVSGFECAVDTGAFAKCATPDELSGLAEGTHKLRVRAIDTASKVDPTPAEQSWVVDTDPPETTIASGPSGLTSHRGPFNFSADEPVDRFECAVDGAAQFTPCFSGYSLPVGLADGEHTLRVRAVDLADNTDASPAERALTLDTTAPIVEIVTAPPPVTHADFTVEFEIDDESATAQCQIDSQGYQACESPIEFQGISDGPHSISIRAVDSLGNVGPAAIAKFTVDELPPETTIENGLPEYFGPAPVEIGFGGSPDTTAFECSMDEEEFSECESPATYEGLDEGPHNFRVRAIDSVGNVDASPAEADFTVDTTAPQTTITAAPSGPFHDATLPYEYESSEPPGRFECALDEGEWRSCEAVLADHRTGSHLFSVRAIDRAGNFDSSPASQSFTVVDQDPEPQLALSKTSGPAPLLLSATITASDPDGDVMRFDLQWGDGGSAEGPVPASGVSHTFTQPGVYLVHLEVDDGFSSTATTQLVTVTAPEPLVADAGDDLTAVAGEPVVLDGGDSRPLEGIGSYHWSLSDGAQGSGARLTHTFQQPGEYESELTVVGVGGTDSDSASVHVVAPAAGGATVLTQHGGAPLEGVQVVVILANGRKVEAVSGNDGIAHLWGVPDGSYKAFARRDGYVPATGNLDVDGGAGTGSVSLEVGDAAGLTVESHPMTLDEIEAAGIDPNDPANLHVYEFSIGGNFVGYVSKGGFSGGSCSRSVCYSHSGSSTTVTSGYWDPRTNAPVLTSMKLPARATFLKEFYDVTVTVTNFAAPGITLEQGRAAIGVPDGMSLAPTASPQSFSRAVADVPGGGSQTLHWILRGDREGEYDIAVSYAAILEPFGESIHLEGTTDKPIKVWGGSALKLKVDLDAAAREGYPYTAFVKLENVADVPVYNPSIELLQAGHHGYIEQPRQRHGYAIRELLPGATQTAGPFIVVPEKTGVLDLASSLVRKIAGDVDLGGTIVSHERSPSFEQTPTLVGHWRNDHDLVLEWEPIPGASSYGIYATPDLQTEFGPDPIAPVHQFGSTKAMVELDRNDPPLVAISSVVNGERKMVHPLLTTATAPTASYPSIQIEDETRCGDPTAHAWVTLEDPDFELTGWGTAAKEEDATAGTPLSGHKFEHAVDVPRAAGHLGKLAVAATNDNPGDGTKKRAASLGSCDYVGLGDSFSSGEGAVEDGSEYEGGHGCHRSPHAYARLLGEREDLNLTSFKACSGAVTADLFNNSINHPDEGPQIDAVQGAELVTLSIGGNNLGFADILKTCIASYVAQAALKLRPVPCKVVWALIVESRLLDLEISLPGELQEIQDRMAPGGRLILLGYPQIFPAFEGLPSPTCLLMHPSDISWMHDMVTRANAALASVVPPGVEFVDPNFGGRFDGHDVCQPNASQSFFQGIRLTELVESFHPKINGQHALMEAVRDEIDDEGFATTRITQGHSIVKTIGIEGANLLRTKIFWPGSDVELSLESPSGAVIDRGHVPSGVIHELGPTSESYEVPNPEPGQWKVKATGLEVAPGGEQVGFAMSQAKPQPEPPLAIFKASAAEGTAPLAIDFDATGSFDPADQALTYAWDFGDGATASGVKATHGFANAGEYVVKLTVKDTDGETDNFESTPIVVKSPEEQPGSTGPGGSGGGAPQLPTGQVGGTPAPRPSSPSGPAKALKCKKGFAKKKAHGRVRCVKVKKHRKKKH